jgi:hypothetical protein
VGQAQVSGPAHPHAGDERAGKRDQGQEDEDRDRCVCPQRGVARNLGGEHLIERRKDEHEDALIAGLFGGPQGPVPDRAFELASARPHMLRPLDVQPRVIERDADVQIVAKHFLELRARLLRQPIEAQVGRRHRAGLTHDMLVTSDQPPLGPRKAEGHEQPEQREHRRLDRARARPGRRRFPRLSPPREPTAQELEPDVAGEHQQRHPNEGDQNPLVRAHGTQVGSAAAAEEDRQIPLSPCYKGPVPMHTPRISKMCAIIIIGISRRGGGTRR